MELPEISLRMYLALHAPEASKEEIESTALASEVEEAIQEQQLRERLVKEAVDDGRKLATIRVITEINDIPGADVIKVAQVEGWQVVVKAGEFQPGDLCLFCEIDSFISAEDTRFAFLEKNFITWKGIRGARLRTIRLRKQLSQGLALPVSMFPEVTAYLDMDRQELRELNFTGILKVMKWEKPETSAQLSGLAKGNFPHFLRKSDQERAANMANKIFGYEQQMYPFDGSLVPTEAIAAMSERGELTSVNGELFKVIKPQASRDTRYEVSLKLDGSSMTVYNKDCEVGVCSRNLELKLEGNEENAFVKAATPIFPVLQTYGKNIALQGELLSPGIQGNREKLLFARYFVYNIFDIDKQEFLSPVDRMIVLAELNQLTSENIEHVPVLAENITLDELGVQNIADLIKFADGPSMNNPVREGLVFKEMNGPKQFKQISNKYLEQTGE